MRLQLTIQRHGLPPVQVLWTLASVVRPPLLAAGNSITISHFLEQVNEVIPLESEEWGLEDYSVEVRGFECLHFSELNQVLKEDDEVCIRPLQTQDLRFRKISGRHQIAADGKHLIDGVAFGRPFLRRADRPAIRIPPRKRRRLTYDEEDDVDTDEPNNDQQIVVRASFDDADDVTTGDQSDDEEDFAPDDEDEDDLGAELCDLQNDIHRASDDISRDHIPAQRVTRSRRSPKGLGLLELLDEDGRPFAGQYNNPLLDFYGQDEVPSSQPEIRLRKRGTKQRLTQNSSEKIRSILRDSSASPQHVSRRDSAGSNRSVRFENTEPATPATIREIEQSEDADDGEFELGELNESDKENAEPQSEETESSESLFEGSQSSSSTSSDDPLSEDETSSSGSSSSSSSSDSETKREPSKDVAHKSETSETSSSGSSSSTSSDSEPEPPKTGQKRKRAVNNTESKLLANEVRPVVTTSTSTTRPPGRGSKMTRNRNQRRRESRKLSFIKSKGILPATATKSDLHKFEEENRESERQKLIAVGGVHAAFEAKRQDLLASISADGVDVSLDPSLQERDGGIKSQSPVRDPLLKAAADQDILMTDQPASKKSPRKLGPAKSPESRPISTPTTAEVQDSTTNMPAKAKENPPTDSMNASTTAIVPAPDTAPPVEAESLANDSQGIADTTEASKSTTTPATELQHRRSKLDVSGAKRMLFGSLGLKTPKTKGDEMKTREKLMKDVRPVREPHVDEKIETSEDVTAAAEDDSWKEKIDLRAVECCYEGIELSTPPFPFFQRWDPQQQKGYNMGNPKKRKGKKRKRNNNDYYEDGSLPAQIKATPRSNHNYYDDNFSNLQKESAALDADHSYSQEVELGPSPEKPSSESNDPKHPHGERFEDSVKVSAQLLHETEDASADTLVDMEEASGLMNDLPTLPDDISVCSSLTTDKVVKGNVVAFKQLEMSAETNWQPKISEYRTAIVDELMDDGTLSMTLAKRDQPLKTIQYDEETGERLYSKFEMPGYHDEDGEDRNGKLEISFDELINPVLVADVSGKDSQDLIVQGQVCIVDHIDSNDKVITEEAHDKDTGTQGFSLDGPIQEVSNRPAESSQEARQEISELMRDAGWRSSINHELTDGQVDGPPDQSNEINVPALAAPSSPNFHHLSSSPLTNGFQVASSPPAAAIQSSKRMHATGSEVAESVSPQRPDHSPARSNILNPRSAIDYPHLPQTNDHSENFQQEAQNRSGLLEADQLITSQDLTLSSSIRRSPSQSNASLILTSPEKSSPKPVNVSDTADSDESLPELFSQAFEKRLSQRREIKSELSEEKSISPPSHRKSKRKKRTNSSQRESDRGWKPDFSESEHENEGGSTPRQSQMGFASEIVDLTISSDTVDPPDDSYVDDDSYVLAKGPGWVQKPRISEPRNSRARKTTRESMRSR